MTDDFLQILLQCEMHNEIMARRQLKTSCSLYEPLAAQRVQERGYRQIEVSAASPLPTFWLPNKTFFWMAKSGIGEL